MASTIKLKNGSGAPLAADLVTAEPALDLTNKRLYTEDSLGNVIEVGTNPTSLTTGDITTTGAVDVTGDLDVDNINIDGNTISSTDTNGNIAITPNGTGEVDISKVDIDSGTIDGTTIGGTTTAAGSFTTLQADTSLNVDGTVTADGLTVDGAGSFSTNLSIRTTSSPSGYNLHVSQDDSDKALAKFTNTTTGTTATDGFDVGLNATEEAIVWHQESKPIRFGTNSLDRLRIDSTGDISFYEDTGTTAKFFWDASAESLGIGTTSNRESTKLDVLGDVTFGSNVSYYGTLGYNAGLGFFDLTSSDGGFRFIRRSGLVESMRIDSSGNVGIGTSSPSDRLEVKGATSTGVIVISSGDTTITGNDVIGQINFKDYDANAHVGGDQDDLVSIKAIALHESGGASALDGSTGEGYALSFSTSKRPNPNLAFTVSEAMRIDSSGNVGIGTSSPSEHLEIFTSVNETPATLSLHSGDTSIAGTQEIGAIYGKGTDSGGSAPYTGAKITFAADGTWDTGTVYYYPTAIKFYTQEASGTDNIAAGPRMTIDSSGLMLINRTTPAGSSVPGLHISGGSDTSASNYTFYTVYNNNAVAFGLRNDGAVRADGVYSKTNASAANVYVDAAGILQRSTSSLRYKTEVQDATHGLSELMQLRPVTYKGINNGDTVFGGLIAEEVHDAGLTEFVQYAPDGNADALAYGNMVSLCIKAIQEQQAQIESLKTRIETLEGN